MKFKDYNKLTEESPSMNIVAGEMRASIRIETVILKYRLRNMGSGGKSCEICDHWAGAGKPYKVLDKCLKLSHEAGAHIDTRKDEVCDAYTAEKTPGSIWK